MKNYLRLLEFLRPYVWPHFLVATICMLGYGATDGALPFVVQWMMDDVFVKKNVANLYYVPLIVIGIFLVRGILNFGHSYLSDYVGLRIVQDVRNRLVQHLQYMSLSFFSRHPSGTLISRVSSDVTLLRFALTDALVSLLKDSTSLIVLVVVAFMMDWFLASIAFVVFPASVLPVMRLSRKIKKLAKRGQISTGTLTAFLQESIQGNRIVKAFGMEEYENQRFAKENQRLFRQSLRASRIRGMVAPVMELLAAFGIGGVVWYGGSSVVGGARTTGEFMAFMAAMFLMYQPFKSLTRTYTSVHQGLAGAERVFEILDESPGVKDRPEARPAPRFSRAIEFHDVSFAYGATPVLKRVNLVIRAGEMVALVGISGAGKSTLADLIPRFYDVGSGRITLDGIDIRDLTLESLRAQIGIVTQHTFLFNDTVRNNIAYGDPKRRIEDVIAAAKAAHAHEFVTAMPKGYDAMVGELGMQLSGGQRQRLAIARALLKNAPILILDEATSSLDSESERLVQDALENLMTTRTTLVIAHRLSTIRKADRIVVLEDGAVAEEGTHEELLSLKGAYSRLHNLQLLENETAGELEALH
ncbi:MAG: lipid A export permease/ATP-binding protein MsbA [Deltaproteobacteria bacterium]|nr:lipid A export permease/ATP-binding protein MsbA [Deltaproteobacteria bacterium]MBI2228318.1 lipid A export permease/ATP-binding protein MsbA [Deltaproteobacteria bacterium]MBI2363440.1 lipid A export permease/ATP-binding protein MsbA [Deltaproteobacteria bacterium]MBI2532621.1 lipid A export permease/ATP-binding protein MsbA [Deltaproteobacteria bacterium]MBI3066764.1 lipid A export permease/ATP-binding protein MsbA [Deltaproteobacteria bacterium]